jgi:hypothetical protein
LVGLRRNARAAAALKKVTIESDGCVKDDDEPGGRSLLLSSFLRLLLPNKVDAPVRWVNRDLAIGCPEDEADWRALRARGMRGVVDLSDEPGDLGPMVRQQGMRYLRLAVADGQLPELEELHIVTSWVLQRVCEEGPVLIHENGARGNHALVAAAALIKRGAGVDRATGQLRNASAAAFGDAQLDLLERFASEMAQVSSRR